MIAFHILELYPDFVGKVIPLDIYALVIVLVVDVHVPVFIA